MFLHALLFCVLLCCKVCHGQDCIEISGIGDSASDVYSLGYIRNNSWPLDSVRRTFYLPLVVGNLETRETAIGIRASLYISLAMYNTLSYYDDIAIEFWARNDKMTHRRRCNDDDEELFEYHRSIAMAYSIAWTVPYFLPESSNTSINLLANYGLDFNICDDGQDCDISTPWGIAKVVFDEIAQFSDNDGFNADGSLNKPYNLIKFEDFRDQYELGSISRQGKYEPVNTPWRLLNINRWQPLLETDDLGFLYRQEHVTSQIGYTGKSFIYSDDEFCDNSRLFQDDNENWPNYDYDIEMELVLNRTRDLTDLDKMLVEQFDSKTVLNRFRGRYIAGLGSGQDTIFSSAASVVNDLTLYEGILAVWKEKVDFDRVRPTSIIQDQLAGTIITSYAGTTEDGESFGTQTFDAIGWEPYIRTMPHAEYPSGSSCVCQAWADGLINWFGTDNWNDTLTNGFTFTYSAFSSSYEPLSTPSETVSQTFYSFSEVSNICGESRLWGGMHFTKSVPAGQILCGNIGETVSDVVKNLLYGHDAAYIDYKPNINDTNIYERDCYPMFDTPDYDANGDSDSSDSSDSNHGRDSSSRSSNSHSSGSSRHG